MILINPGMVLPLYRRQFFGLNAEADFLKNCRVGAQLSLEVLLSDQSYAEFLCDVTGFDFCLNTVYVYYVWHMLEQRIATPVFLYLAESGKTLPTIQ